ncbi:MAG TPA: type II toxin-antitoxin system YafQ family toxin [Prolixibacteraceae bacterium]|nr:type II toxin-antitoxin system YafQ family toxin [Prolixibacteraceae bacterium]
MYRIEFTRQYMKDLRIARRRNLDEGKLNDIVRMLCEEKELPQKHRNHPLSGPFNGLFECHITPDWLLIYSRNELIRLITLIWTGTHSDLF